MKETAQEILFCSTRLCSWLAFFLAAFYMVCFFAVLPVHGFCLALASVASTWIVLFAGFSLWKIEIWHAREILKKEREERS